jgi:signal recognition particle receptor subunit beta
VQLSESAVTLKLVYYGPGLGGKTTNLVALKEILGAGESGRLVTLGTADERTLFFDLLPLELRDHGVSVQVKVFTVPGQRIHAATRKLVLAGADGVAFVADSRQSQIQANVESFLEMKQNLSAYGVDPESFPLVIQFNKQDLEDIRGVDELRRMAAKSKEPIYPAVASRREGVAETFVGLFQLTWHKLNAEHRLCERLGLSSQPVLLAVARRLGLNHLTIEDLAATYPKGGFQPSPETGETS